MEMDLEKLWDKKKAAEKLKYSRIEAGVKKELDVNLNVPQNQ